VIRAAALCGALLLLRAGAAGAEERHALVVAGASGGPPYAQQYAAWTASLSQALVERLAFEPAHVTVLMEGAEPARVSTAANVRRAVAGLRQRMRPGDVLLVVLLGHGTFDGIDAKFNLVGPDLDAAEWAALVQPLPGRLVLVNTTASSFPFLERLSGPGRIVVTATDSPVQRFDTVFPEHFVAAFQDDAADIDKNGRISIWEAFACSWNCCSGARRSPRRSRSSRSRRRSCPPPSMRGSSSG
jgi:hypothetical protein